MFSPALIRALDACQSLLAEHADRFLVIAAQQVPGVGWAWQSRASAPTDGQGLVEAFTDTMLFGSLPPPASPEKP